MTRLSWPGWLGWTPRRYTPWTVTHLSINPARRRVTSLICPTTLPLSQTATSNLKGNGKIPDDREVLNKAMRNGDRLLLHSFNNQVGTGSNHDCLFGISRINFNTSASVTHWNSNMLTRLSATSCMTETCFCQGSLGWLWRIGYSRTMCMHYSSWSIAHSYLFDQIFYFYYIFVVYSGYNQMTP